MSAVFLFIGAIFLLGSVAHRAYFELTGNGMAIETYVMLCWVASFGAFLLICGILFRVLSWTMRLDMSKRNSIRATRH